MGLHIEKFNVGMDSNCYVVSDDTFLDAIVIDPGFFDSEFDKIIGHIRMKNLSVTHIVNTHGHPDHTTGNKLMKNTTGAPILIHKDDEVFLKHTNWPELISNLHPETSCPKCGNTSKPAFTIQENSTVVLMGCKHCDFIVPFDASTNADQHLNEGDTISLGEFEFTVFHTPGHSPGGVCIYNAKEKILFSGDTLFNHGTGRVDNPFSNPDDMQKSLNRLWEFPDATKVLSGHGPDTTIGAEKPRYT